MDLFDKLMERKGGSSAPREPPLATGLKSFSDAFVYMYINVCMLFIPTIGKNGTGRLPMVK